MGAILWVLAVVCGALGILTMVGGHVWAGVLLIVLATILGFVASATSMNLE